MCFFYFQTPPTVRRHGTGYGTLPANLSPPNSPTVGSEFLRAQSTSTISSTSARPPQGPGARKPPPHKSSPTRSRTTATGNSPNANNASNSNKDQASTMPRKTRGLGGFASFGKGLLKLRTGKWSSSAPNLGDTDRVLSQPVTGSRLG